MDVAISKQRSSNLGCLLSGILKKGALTPGLAAKIRGKLSFAASLGFGKIGRGMLRPIARRQYSSGSYKIEGELKICLQWWIGFLTHIPPRTVSLGEEIIIPMRTDAMGFGHVG